MLPPKIAVIHDDPAVSNLLLTFLEDEGYLPIAYLEPDTTVEQLHSSIPDLAIIELSYSSSQQRETLVDQFRADPLTRHVPVIVLTTAADPESVRPESCRDNCEVLPVPFDLDTLQGLIRSLLKSPQYCRCG